MGEPLAILLIGGAAIIFVIIAGKKLVNKD